MAKRTLALFLCLLMAGSAFSCGSDEPSGGDTTANGGETTPDATGEHSGVPADVDFGGETVRILNGTYFEKQYAYFNVEESTGDSLNDAIYDRNLAVMDKLDVKLEIENFDIYKNHAVVRSNIMAGDDSWDFIMGMQYRITQLTPEGLFTDLSDAPYIDISKPWWAKGYIEDLNIGDDHLYLLSGDYSIGTLNQYSAMYYNKNLYEDYFKNPDEMYDIVLDGKWTLDKLYELSSGAAKDLNGDTKIDYINDQFGFGIQATSGVSFVIQHLIFDAGAGVTVYKDGEYSFEGATATNTAVVEKLQRLIYDNPGYAEIERNTDGGDTYDNRATSGFIDGRMMFLTGLLSYADLLREMEDDYGIIPYPKLDESGEYRSLVHDQAMLLVVPTTCQNLDRAAAVMEELTFLGWRDMIPEYYNIVLKQKYMRDDQNAAMQVIDIVHDSGSTELAFLYSHTLNLFDKALMMSVVKDGNVASNFDANISANQEKLAELLEYFNQ